MRKGIVVFIIITSFLLGLYYSAKIYIIPEMIAQSVASDNPPPEFLPQEIKETVVDLKENVNENVEKLPVIMNELQLDFDDLLYIVDHVDADEVMNSLDELGESSWTTTDDAFDIIIKNVHVEGYELEIFRPLFKDKATRKRINRMLDKIEENKLRTSISVPVARNTVKRILLDNRQKIESELTKIN